LSYLHELNTFVACEDSIHCLAVTIVVVVAVAIVAVVVAVVAIDVNAASPELKM